MREIIMENKDGNELILKLMHIVTRLLQHINSIKNKTKLKNKIKYIDYFVYCNIMSR